MTSDEIVIRDEGTGLESVVLGTLGARVPAEAEDGGVSRRIVIELRSIADADDAVELRIDAELLRCHRDDLPERLLAWLTRYRLGQPLPVVRLHAGAAVSERGGAVLVVGASGSGKSTLVAHFRASGRPVMSDEMIAVHDGARFVSSFERPLMVRPDVAGLLGEPSGIPTGSGNLIIPSDGDGSYCPSANPEIIVFPERREDAGPVVDFEVLEPGEAFERLCANTFDLAISPSANIRRLADLAACVPAARIAYRDAPDAVAAILHRRPAPLDISSYRPRQPGVVRSDPPSRRLIPAPEIVPGVYTVDFGRTIVLVDAEIRRTARLNEVASQQWRRLLSGARPHKTDEAFVEELGRNQLVRRAEWSTPQRRLHRAWRRLLQRHWIGPPIGKGPINEYAEGNQSAAMTKG